MSQRKLNHLSDQRHLFSATSDIVISNFIKLLFVFSVDRLSFGEKHCIRGYNTELFGLCSDYLEFNRFEISSYNKEISLFYWPISILEIWNQIGFGKISSETFNGILQREDMDFSEIWDFSGRPYLDNVTQSDSEIFSDGFVHSDFSLFNFIIDEGDDESLFSLFTLDKDGVAFEDFEFGHFGLRELDGGVFIIEGFFNLKDKRKRLQ